MHSVDEGARWPSRRQRPLQASCWILDLLSAFLARFVLHEHVSWIVQKRSTKPSVDQSALPGANARQVLASHQAYAA
jgi:hypothetical protein